VSRYDAIMAPAAPTKDHYDCKRCGTRVVFGQYIKTVWAKPQPDRCPRCGAVHAVLLGDVDVISPVVLPLGAPGRTMPWQLPHTRPIVAGMYECRFSDCEPTILVLHWDGRNFIHDGKRVRTATFLSWRGGWE